MVFFKLFIICMLNGKKKYGGKLDKFGGKSKKVGFCGFCSIRLLQLWALVDNNFFSCKKKSQNCLVVAGIPVKKSQSS